MSGTAGNLQSKPDDVEMTNAEDTPTIPSTAIGNKVKDNLLTPAYGEWIDTTGFIYDFLSSTQLKALRNAQVVPIGFDGIVGEGSQLYGCDVGKLDFFLRLSSVVDQFYIRDGYDALFAKIKSCWQVKGRKRVTLIGNAGTGKSWFQVYVLQELLRDPSGYNFIVRHVGKTISLIDLEQCSVYVWTFKHPELVEQLLDNLKNAVYLYEPAQEKEQPPLGLLGLPSLATLSPYNGRIAEYKKVNYTELYFWPWSYSAMNAMAQHSKSKITPDEIWRRYLKFGGIVRHVLAEDAAKASRELAARLANISLSVLQSKALNIDRTETGNNVSGYILCYNNKQEDESRFTTPVLEFTSQEVEDKVQEMLNNRPFVEKAKTVLARLNKEVVDLSGKNLEAVATELLSKGTYGTGYQWQSKEVGGEGRWSTFILTKRDVVRLWDVYELLQKQKQILVSTNPNFPLGDIVFTPNSLSGPIDVVQFTWQTCHPFTVRALYDLRVNRLKIGHEVHVKVYIISPGKEDRYAGMQKTDFLKGSLTVPFKWSVHTEPVQPSDLLAMWNSTEVRVIRPLNTDWKTLIGNCITTLPAS